MAAALPNSKGAGRKRRYGVSANAVITRGHMVMLDGGYAEDPAASAGNDGIAGIALEDVDNTGGADGDVTVLVMDQISVLLAALSITAAMVGDIMFATNATTFDETDTTNLPEAGRLEHFESTTSGWVYIDADLNKVQGT
jgi:hypothetical protein